MKKTNDSQPYSRRPTPAPQTTPNSTPPDGPDDESDLAKRLLAANEELNDHLAELEAANDLLRSQLEASEQARITAEARVLHLTGVIEESAQDLQRFEQNYFVPASITSITRDVNGVCMNGIPLGLAAMDKGEDQTAATMRQLAALVNAQKAALRQKAQSPPPDPKPFRPPNPKPGSSDDSGDA